MSTNSYPSNFSFANSTPNKTKYNGHGPINLIKSQLGGSNIKKPIGDEDDGSSLYMEDTCKVCASIAQKCRLINARYCSSCKEFTCNDCTYPFSEKKTCRCQRCVICFQEYCYHPMIIGKNCQTLCNLCLESNPPETFNILRYPCGHGFCSLCVMNNTIDKKWDPRYCYLCSRP